MFAGFPLSRPHYAAGTPGPGSATAAG